MDAFDDDTGHLSTKSIPELIKHLWGLYFAMSFDPALASSAEHLRQAALTLEHARRVAFEVSQEDQPDTSPADAEGAEDEDQNHERAGHFRRGAPGSLLKH